MSSLLGGPLFYSAYFLTDEGASIFIQFKLVVVPCVWLNGASWRNYKFWIFCRKMWCWRVTHMPNWKGILLMQKRYPVMSYGVCSFVEKQWGNKLPHFWIEVLSIQQNRTCWMKGCMGNWAWAYIWSTNCSSFINKCNKWLADYYFFYTVYQASCNNVALCSPSPDSSGLTCFW